MMFPDLDRFIRELEEMLPELKAAESLANHALEEAKTNARITARRVTVAEDALAAALELKNWLQLEGTT